MRVEMACVPKDRQGRIAGDDVPLIVPGCVFGVFDGATDALNTVVDGVPAGRLAALTVAGATARFLQDVANRRLPADEVFGNLSAALRRETAGRALPIPPSTTLALAIDCGSDWRFVLLGDSGIRLNGTEVLQRTKVIDDVSTQARIALFLHLDATMRETGTDADPDKVELATRRAIFLGLDHAVTEGVLPLRIATDIVASTADAFKGAVNAASVESFLRGGISKQFHHANATGDALCFDTMNGGVPRLGQAIDETRPKADIRSIELFTDGYADVPPEVSVASWEALHGHVEHVDFHMTGPFGGVKGATSTQFFDDRTVIVLTGPGS